MRLITGGAVRNTEVDSDNNEVTMQNSLLQQIKCEVLPEVPRPQRGVRHQ